METISACNLHCKMCAHRNSMTGQSLDKEKISEIFRDIQKLNEINMPNPFVGMRLDGNTEPLMYEHFKWLVEKCRDNSPAFKPKIQIITNGLLLNEDIARFILTNDISSVKVSMTGLTVDVYRNFQGSNLHDDICAKNLETISKNVCSLISLKREINAKTEIELRYIVAESSKDEIVPYYDYWYSQGADKIVFFGLGDGILKEKSSPKGKKMGIQHCRRFGQVVVQAKGDVLLSCCDYLMESVGNIYEQSFYNIMSSKKVLKYEKAHEELDITNLPEICINCPDMHVYEENRMFDINYSFIDQDVLFSNIYLDTGRGFNPVEIESIPVLVSQNHFSLTINLTPHIKGIRFDPVEGLICILNNLKIMTDSGELKYLCTNGIEVYGGLILFETLDPQIVIDFSTKIFSSIKISGDIYLFHPVGIDVLSKFNFFISQYFEGQKKNEFLQKSLDNIILERNNMLNSRSWRFTRPIRRLADFIQRNRILYFFCKKMLPIKRK